MQFRSLVTSASALLFVFASAGQAAAVSISLGFEGNPATIVNLSNADGSLGCGAPGALGQLTCTGSGLNNGGWTLTNWNIFTDPDPQIANTFSVTNNTTATQSFFFTVSLPTNISFGPPSLIRGSVSGSATDLNGNGVSLSSNGTSPIYDALIDGATIRTLLDPPQSFSTALAFDSVSTGVNKYGIPIQESVAVATVANISLTIRFDLSAGDSAAFTSVFDVQPVPEPGAALLLGLGLIGLARRSRSV